MLTTSANWGFGVSGEENIYALTSQVQLGGARGAPPFHRALPIMFLAGLAFRVYLPLPGLSYQMSGGETHAPSTKGPTQAVSVLFVCLGNICMYLRTVRDASHADCDRT
jgi:hypothetical protein